MVNRHTYPTRYDGCDIVVATEQMKDGNWSAVATVRHHAGDAVQHTPMPVTHERFGTEEEARQFGVAQATEYLERIVPAA